MVGGYTALRVWVGFDHSQPSLATVDPRESNAGKSARHGRRQHFRKRVFLDLLPFLPPRSPLLSCFWFRIRNGMLCTAEDSLQPATPSGPPQQKLRRRATYLIGLVCVQANTVKSTQRQHHDHPTWFMAQRPRTSDTQTFTSARVRQKLGIPCLGSPSGEAPGRSLARRTPPAAAPWTCRARTGRGTPRKRRRAPAAWPRRHLASRSQSAVINAVNTHTSKLVRNGGGRRMGAENPRRKLIAAATRGEAVRRGFCHLFGQQTPHSLELFQKHNTHALEENTEVKMRCATELDNPFSQQRSTQQVLQTTPPPPPK